MKGGYSYCVSGNTKPCSARYEGRRVGYQSFAGNAGKRKTVGRAINHLTNGDDLIHTHTHTHTQHTHTRTATPVPATASPTRTPTSSPGRTLRGAPRVSCSPPPGTTGTAKAERKTAADSSSRWSIPSRCLTRSPPATMSCRGDGTASRHRRCGTAVRISPSPPSTGTRPPVIATGPITVTAFDRLDRILTEMCIVYWSLTERIGARGSERAGDGATRSPFTYTYISA